MAKFIEYNVENEEDILLGMKRVEAQSRIATKRLLDNLADFGYHVLQSSVPRHTSYLLRHVARSDVTWRPGGAGGGGSWEAVIGVKRGESKHPLYVEFGTGIYGAVGWFIVPVRAQYMTFYSTRFHRVINVTHTRGQRPQRYLYHTWRELLVYARGRMMLADMFK